MPRAYLNYVQRTINEYPPNWGTADAEYLVTADDGMDYVVKTIRKHPEMPAAEWMCHNIADSCGIATPQYTFIELMNGDVGFGSQWDESTVDLATKTAVASAIPGDSLLAKRFSAIYAIDQFAHNQDRHFNNYFFVRTNTGIGVKAYDFSRGLHVNGWPLPNLPLPRHCNTVTCYSALRVGYPFSKPSALEVVHGIRSIDHTTIENWLNEMPASWMDNGTKLQFVDWWKSAVPLRIGDLTKGIEDESIL
jgi:HipA-like protein